MPPPIGLGCHQPVLCLYTPHRPPLPRYQRQRSYRVARPGETARIIAETGNHWRKILSIFAKIYCQLFSPPEPWQKVRDQHLLTGGSRTALLWQTQLLPAEGAIHIIGGRDFAAGFELPPSTARAVDGMSGKITAYGHCYLTPYLDYRQFPNALIDAFCNHLLSNHELRL